MHLQSPSVHDLRQHLYESLRCRILDVPVPPAASQLHQVRLAILFSGGLDCTVLARMAHDLLPEDQEIDLLNVAFENPRVVKAAKAGPKIKKSKQKGLVTISPQAAMPDSPQDQDLSDLPSPYECCPDRETGRKAFQELQNVCPGRIWRFVAVSILYPCLSLSSLSHVGQRSIHRDKGA